MPLWGCKQSKDDTQMMKFVILIVSLFLTHKAAAFSWFEEILTRNSYVAEMYEVQQCYDGLIAIAQHLKKIKNPKTAQNQCEVLAKMFTRSSQSDLRAHYLKYVEFEMYLESTEKMNYLTDRVAREVHRLNAVACYDNATLKVLKSLTLISDDYFSHPRWEALRYDAYNERFSPPEGYQYIDLIVQDQYRPSQHPAETAARSIIKTAKSLCTPYLEELTLYQQDQIFIEIGHLCEILNQLRGSKDVPIAIESLIKTHELLDVFLSYGVRYPKHEFMIAEYATSLYLKPLKNRDKQLYEQYLSLEEKEFFGSGLLEVFLRGAILKLPPYRIINNSISTPTGELEVIWDAEI